MARIDFAALANPLSENDPCGPDLDMRGDEDYLNFVTIAEGILPTEFFTEGAPFDAATIDVDGQIARMAPFLGRTRDLRLLSLLARFLVLDRDLAAFVAVIEAIGRLLEFYWDKVHPSAERETLPMRAAAIATLNEPTVCIPLQYMRLCDDRRFGVITLRTQMYAKGEAKPREGETTPAYPSIIQALRECATDHFDATRNLIARLAASLARIHSLFAEHCGFDKTPGLDKITATVARMMALLDEAVPTEEQKKIAAAGGIDQTGTGLIRNAFGTRMALQAVIEYFTRHEPSSPALPLIAQARELQGKTFVEVMQTLLPSKAGDAAYSIGDPKVFALPLEKLAAIMPSIDNYALEQGSTNSCQEGVALVSDAPAPPPVFNQDASEALARNGDEGAELAPSHAADEVLTKDESTFAATADSPTMQATGRLQFAAATRQEAISILNEVIQYLRIAEPSSPIPWLIDRAKELADRDFLSVLSSILPEDALP